MNIITDDQKGVSIMSSIFDKLTKTFSDTADTASKKADQFARTSRIRMKIHSVESQMNDEYENLGRLVFSQYKSGQALDSAYADACEEILSLEDQISELKRKLSDARGERFCPNCGKAVEPGNAFCPACGAKLPAFEEEQEDDSQESDGKSTAEETVESPESAPADETEEEESAAEEAAAEVISEETEESEAAEENPAPAEEPAPEEEASESETPGTEAE